MIGKCMYIDPFDIYLLPYLLSREGMMHHHHLSGPPQLYLPQSWQNGPRLIDLSGSKQSTLGKSLADTESPIVEKTSCRLYCGQLLSPHLLDDFSLDANCLRRGVSSSLNCFSNGTWAATCILIINLLPKFRWWSRSKSTCKRWRNRT